MFNSVHMAKYAKRRELGIELDDPRVVKFVGYFGEGSYVGCERALMIKDIFHRRSVPYVYNKDILNYELDVDRFEEMLAEDVAKGLIPFWFGFSYGNTFSSAIDVSERALEVCKRHNIFIHVDAAWLGSTWISEKYRPDPKLMKAVDSIDINFTKLLLNGTGGSLFFIADKKLIVESFGSGDTKFPFWKNKFSGKDDVVDYKDWTVGNTRRNNAIKLYYMYDHFGLKKIREAVEGMQEKYEYLISLIEGETLFFQMHTRQYGLVNFRALGKDGEPCNELTKAISAKVANIVEGFSTPGSFQDREMIRIVVGQFHTTKEQLKAYFDAIMRATRSERENVTGKEECSTE